MSLFGKNDDASPAHSQGAGLDGYGITDLIGLLKVIPVDHHPQLVVQVIKTTLESVGVKSAAVIEDALAQEHRMREAIEMLESQIIVLSQEIQDRQQQIAELDVALRETVGAKNLLTSAESSFTLSEIDLNQDPDATGTARSLPPPLPPPRRAVGSEESQLGAQGR